MGQICMECGAEFERIAEYTQHRKEHVEGRIPTKTSDQLLREQGGDDIVAEPVIEEPALGKPGPTATGEQIEKPWNREPPLEQRKKQGIKLTYHYAGYCEECGVAPETLELEGVVADSTKIVTVAWCPKCKKKLHQRQVINLYPKKTDVPTRNQRMQKVKTSMGGGE